MTKKEANTRTESAPTSQNITLIPLIDIVESRSLRALLPREPIVCFDFHVASPAPQEIVLPDSTLVGYTDPETNIS